MATHNPIPPILTAKDAVRFWSRVSCSVDLQKCWEWTAGRFSNNYGAFQVQNRGKERCLRAHRVALLLMTGEWPEVAMHKCDNPPCCNPTHVIAGTDLENHQDAARKGRTPQGDRHRSKTHPHTVPRGESHTKAKLTEEKVRLIRIARAAGVTRQSLADQYGVRPQSIYSIEKGKNWKWLI